MKAPLPESLSRYLDSDPAAALHKCAIPSCRRMTAHGRYCSNCLGQLQGLDAWRAAREANRAGGNPISRAWRRLMAWTPSESELARLGRFAVRAARVGDDFLKLAVIFAAIYLAAEIGTAFLPGGAVHRILSGGR